MGFLVLNQIRFSFSLYGLVSKVLWGTLVQFWAPERSLYFFYYCSCWFAWMWSVQQKVFHQMPELNAHSFFFYSEYIIPATKAQIRKAEVSKAQGEGRSIQSSNRNKQSLSTNKIKAITKEHPSRTKQRSRQTKFKQMQVRLKQK